MHLEVKFYEGLLLPLRIRVVSGDRFGPSFGLSRHGQTQTHMQYENITFPYMQSVKTSKNCSPNSGPLATVTIQALNVFVFRKNYLFFSKLA